MNASRNQLQIDFFAISFGLGESLRYQYKLEGASADWSTPGDERSVNYASLAPGAYRFLVRAVNSAGAVSESPAIIEDQRDIRECLTFLINGTAGYACTASFRTMEEVLERIGAQLPDVVLSDIGLPRMSGIDGIKILKARYPNLLMQRHRRIWTGWQELLQLWQHWRKHGGRAL